MSSLSFGVAQLNFSLSDLAFDISSCSSSSSGNAPVATPGLIPKVDLYPLKGKGRVVQDDEKGNHEQFTKVARTAQEIQLHTPRVKPNDTIALSVVSSSSLNAPSCGSLAASLSLTPTVKSASSSFNLKKATLQSLYDARKDRAISFAFSKVEITALDIFTKHFLTIAIKEAEAKPQSYRLPRGTTFEHGGSKYTLPRSVEIIFAPKTKQARVCLALNRGTCNPEKKRQRDSLDKLVSFGFSKRVKFAVDLCTGELIIRQSMQADKQAAVELKGLSKYSRHYGMIDLLGHVQFDSKSVDNSGTPKRKLALFLPYCHFGSLDHVIHDNRIFSKLVEKQKLHFVHALLSAIEAIHNDGRVHADVKPRNILLDNKMGIHLIDFGFMHKAGHYKKCGTRNYLAPELIAGFLDDGDFTEQVKSQPSRDMWAVGYTIYELVSGYVPSQEFDDAMTTKNLWKIKQFLTKAEESSPSLIHLNQVPHKNGEPDKESLLYLAHSLMSFKPESRLAATQAREVVEKLLKAAEDQ